MLSFHLKALVIVMNAHVEVACVMENVCTILLKLSQVDAYRTAIKAADGSAAANAVKLKHSAHAVLQPLLTDLISILM